MTDLLRSPYGTEELRPIQAVMLLEASEIGGLAANARVGAGKTLACGLLPTVLHSQRPLLVVPANRVEPTEKEFRRLRDHWQIPNNYPIKSYSKLGLSQHHNLLWAYKPDLLVCDEAQLLKAVKTAAVARRVARYLAEFPETRVCCLSGTLTKGSILDYAHILVWCLRHGAPVPIDPLEQEEWAAALDNKTAKRADPVILIPALGKEAGRGIEAGRAAYRKRLVATPGVVFSVDQYDGSELRLNHIELRPPEETDAPFDDLRTLWLAPDGWPMADARFEVWGVARQLALGFYYRHDPWPPKPWFEQRKQYCKMVRSVLETSSDWDSEKQVSDACAASELDSYCVEVWEEWRAIEPSFKIKKVPEWLSDFAIDAAFEWGKRGPGIIWTEHRAFAQRLARKSGWASFGSKGQDAQGRSIEDVRDETIIASIKANGTGANLQYGYHRNLITSPLTTGRDSEQLHGRTHREGQSKPIVYSDYLIASYEHITACVSALDEAKYTYETTGQPQKLLESHFQIPSGPLRVGHAAWKPTRAKG